jgi:hypothetical protein
MSDRTNHRPFMTFRASKTQAGQHRVKWSAPIDYRRVPRISISIFRREREQRRCPVPADSAATRGEIAFLSRHLESSVRPASSLKPVQGLSYGGLPSPTWPGCAKLAAIRTAMAVSMSLSLRELNHQNRSVVWNYYVLCAMMYRCSSGYWSYSRCLQMHPAADMSFSRFGFPRTL